MQGGQGTSLIRCHLSRNLKEGREEALQISKGNLSLAREQQMHSALRWTLLCVIKQ